MENKKSTTTILIIIIVLLIGGYALIVPSLISKDNQNNTSEDQNTNKNSNGENEENTSYVVEAYHKHINLKFPENMQPDEHEKNLDINWHVILPKITIKTTNAYAFNQKILNDYQELIKTTNEKKEKDPTTGSNHTNYDYYINNNIIFIIITSNINTLRGSGGTTYKGYYYNIAEDKELSTKDVLNKYHITIEEINNRINELNKDEWESDKIISNIKDVNDIDAIKVTDSDESFTFYKGLQSFYLYKPKN